MPTDTEISSWTVLIIDDSLDNVGVAKTVFAHFGASVYTAPDGDEGLKLLATIHPTIVLLDISMPIRNGWETLKAIRENENTKDLIVIAVTAHAMRGDREKAIDAGFNGYIAKPFHIRDLIQYAKDVVLGTPTPDASATQPSPDVPENRSEGIAPASTGKTN